MLEGFVAVTAASELPPGSMKWVVIDRERVLVANVGGSFYALRDVCGQAGAPLSTGELVGCGMGGPLHYGGFDIRTGGLCRVPASGDVPTCQVRVEGDTVYVKR